jgi:hypothetical protein
MISGTSIFSMADLNSSESHLYGKYEKNGIIIDVECIEEDEAKGTTYVRIRNSEEWDEIKTSKIFDMQHSSQCLW